MTERMSDEILNNIQSAIENHGYLSAMCATAVVKEASRSRAAESALLDRVRELEALGLSSTSFDYDWYDSVVQCVVDDDVIGMFHKHRVELAKCRQRVKELEEEVAAGARLVTHWIDRANDYRAQAAEFRQEIVDCPIEEVRKEPARYKAAHERAMGVDRIPLEYKNARATYSAGWNEALDEVRAALRLEGDK